MTVFGTELRYGAVAQAFHWVTAVLVFAAWLVAEGDRSPTITLHETLGLAVFVLVAVRLLWRAFDRQPEQPVHVLAQTLDQPADAGIEGRPVQAPRRLHRVRDEVG